MLFVNIGIALRVLLDSMGGLTVVEGIMLSDVVLVIAISIGFVFTFLAAQHVFLKTHKFNETVGSGAIFGAILFVSVHVVNRLVQAAVGLPNWAALNSEIVTGLLGGGLVGAVFFALAIIALVLESRYNLKR